MVFDVLQIGQQPSSRRLTETVGYYKMHLHRIIQEKSHDR